MDQGPSGIIKRAGVHCPKYYALRENFRVLPKGTFSFGKTGSTFWRPLRHWDCAECLWGQDQGLLGVSMALQWSWSCGHLGASVLTWRLHWFPEEFGRPTVCSVGLPNAAEPQKACRKDFWVLCKNWKCFSCAIWGFQQHQGSPQRGLWASQTLLDTSVTPRKGLKPPGAFGTMTAAAPLGYPKLVTPLKREWPSFSSQWWVVIYTLGITALRYCRRDMKMGGVWGYGSAKKCCAPRCQIP